MAGGVTGWDLWSVLAHAAQEEEYYRTTPPVACPNDGEPLVPGPPSSANLLFCKFDGWQYPRDWDPRIHSGM